jgi:signal transduction histidine kinase
MRFSIRDKILGVLGLLLVTAVCFYTILASFIFSEQKTALLYDLNHSIAVNTAAQLRASLSQVGNQLRVFAISQILSSRSELRLPTDFLKDTPILGARLFRRSEGSLTEEKLGDTPGFAAASVEGLLAEAEANGLAFDRLESPESGARFFIAQKVSVQTGREAVTHLAVAELSADSILRPLQAANLFRSYLVKGDGRALVALDRSAVTKSEGLESHPLLARAKAQGAGSSGVSSFKQDKEEWYGAYAPVEVGNLYFLTQASRKEVTSAILTLVERSVLFGLIVITLTFIASVLFSKRLTRNLQILTQSARRIEKGDLDSQIAISSRDEIQELASSFNAMMVSLKASREEIERYNRELEDRVAQRTEQLQEANASIKAVQEKLLKTTQLAAVGEVAGRTAHELLNPLTAIMSRLERSRGVIQASGGAAAATLPLQLTEILSAWENDYRAGGMTGLTSSLQVASSVKPDITLFEEDLDNLKKLAGYWKQQVEVLNADLGFVQDQSQRIHRIVDGMRELVRSSVKAEVRCQEALKEACLTMADFLSKNRVKLESELNAEKDAAYLNRDEFIQIVTNLMRNAFQAIQMHAEPEKRAEGRITVKAQSLNHQFLVDIVDNGIGVPEDKRHKLFEQGFTTKAPSEGTGLGLAICRRYAHAFGGEVELLYSEPGGRGTCFRITVPLKDGPAVKMAS